MIKRVTLVSDELPKGCGLDTYHTNLFSHMKNKGVNIVSVKTKKLLGNYPVKTSSKIKTKLVHFTDQKSAAVLFFTPFRKYKSVITAHDVIEIINFNNVCKTNSLYKKIIHFIPFKILIICLAVFL